MATMPPHASAASRRTASRFEGSDICQEYRTPIPKLQGVLNHDGLPVDYLSIMARLKATSRSGSHTRDRNPQHPVARFCRLARIRAKLTQPKLAAKLGLTKAAISQWETGKTQPGLDDLIRLSLLSRVSLGAVTAFADAMRRGHAEPLVGDFDARLTLLPDLLREDVLASLVKNEKIAEHFPNSGSWSAAAD